MKKLCLLIVSLILFCEGFTNQPEPGYPLSICASKNSRKTFFRIGEPVKVHYESGNGETVAKGYIIRITKDSAEIGSFNNGKKSYFFDITSLRSITHLNRGTRRELAVGAIIIALLMGLVIVVTGGGVIKSIWGAILLLIIGISALYVLAIFLGLSYLVEVLRKRSSKKGWSFSIEEAPPRKKRNRLFY